MTDPTSMVVGDLEMHPVACVPADAPLAEAVRVLAATEHGVIVVLSEPLAEVTEADVVAVLASGSARETKLGEVTRGAPQFVGRDTLADEAVAIMVVTGRRALVVVEEGRPIGIVTLRTAIGALWGGKSWLGAFRVALHAETS